MKCPICKGDVVCLYRCKFYKGVDQIICWVCYRKYYRKGLIWWCGKEQ